MNYLLQIFMIPKVPDELVDVMKKYLEERKNSGRRLDYRFWMGSGTLPK